MSNSAGGEIWKRWTNCCDHNSFLACNIISESILLVGCTAMNHLKNWFADFTCWTFYFVRQTDDDTHLARMWSNWMTIIIIYGVLLYWFCLAAADFKSLNAMQSLGKFIIHDLFSSKQLIIFIILFCITV